MLMESDLDPAGILMLRRAAQAFGIHQDFSPIGNGNINDTYLSEDGKYLIVTLADGSTPFYLPIM